MADQSTQSSNQQHSPAHMVIGLIFIVLVIGGCLGVVSWFTGDDYSEQDIFEIASGQASLVDATSLMAGGSSAREVLRKPELNDEVKVAMISSMIDQWFATSAPLEWVTAQEKIGATGKKIEWIGEAERVQRVKSYMKAIFIASWKLNKPVGRVSFDEARPYTQVE